jgi:hypothetical protein
MNIVSKILGIINGTNPANPASGKRVLFAKSDGWYDKNSSGTTVKLATTADVTAPYLVYTALLTQSGTNAPVATVLENTLGGTVVWSRDVAGIYVATLSGAFPANKTTPISQREQQSADNVDDIPQWLTGLRLTDNTYGLNTGNFDSGLSDSVLNGAFIEIRVYP